MKRILTIQDISCFGRCSTTIALPVLSAMGLETVVLPTAVLSTHTMFSGCTFRDLTGDLLPSARHWASLGVHFDTIYTGYLGSAEAVDAVLEILRLLRAEDTLVFIDPVMGDGGRLYTGFDETNVRRCAALCREADVFVPNITEACLLTGTAYAAPGSAQADRAYYSGLLDALHALGARTSVLTGVSLEDGKTGILGRSDHDFSVQTERVEASYHGTGDLFSSVSAGALTLGLAPEEAFRMACEFTAETIRATLAAGGDPRTGIAFEGCLPDLIRRVQEALR